PGGQCPHGPHRTRLTTSSLYLRRRPPLRFARLLLASLGNASGVAAVRRPSRTHPIRARPTPSPPSASLRSAPPRFARQLRQASRLAGRTGSGASRPLGGCIGC